jgi:hypothetical protein
MKFNLKDKLRQAKDAGTAALSIAVLTVDAAADRALDKLSDLQDAAGRKTDALRTAVGEKVDLTKEVIKGGTEIVKEKTVTNLGKIGDAIETRALQVGSAATAFGKSARSRLNLRKEQPVAEEVATAAVKTATKKPGKKRSKKKAQAPKHR